MTYSQYLLQGGTVSQDEQMLLLMEIANLFKLDPMSVLLLVGEEQAPQLLEAMGLLAELTGDQELMSVVELVAQAISDSRSQAMKRGGTIKEGKGKIPEGRCGKKIKKALVGVLLPKGAHGQTWSEKQKSTTIFGKGGCPCKLHKVGGRLIEVDGCLGAHISMAKNGIKMFQLPDSPIYKIGNKEYVLSSNGWVTADSGARVLSLDTIDKLDALRNHLIKSSSKVEDGLSVTLADGTLYRQVTTPSLFGELTRWYKIDQNGNPIAQEYNTDTLAILNSHLQLPALATEKTRLLPKLESTRMTFGSVNGFNYRASRNAQNESTMLNSTAVQSSLPATTAVLTNNIPATSANSERIEQPIMSADERMFRARLADKNQLSDYSLAGRLAWVKDNADYLRLRGWNDARINDYKGSAADNRLLLLYMNEQATWQKPTESAQVEPTMPSTRLWATALQLPENKLFSQYNPLTYSLKPLDFTLSRTPVSTGPTPVEQNTSTEPASSTIPLGRYSLFGMKYATNSNGDVVEDWGNTDISAMDIQRSAIKENRRLGREYRNSLRRQIPLLQRSGTNFNELIRQSREAERVANNQARQWAALLENAYRQSRINRANSQMGDIQTPTFYKSGGLIPYSDYLNK